MVVDVIYLGTLATVGAYLTIRSLQRRMVR